MRKLLFSIFVVLTIFAYSSDGCSLAGKSLSKFDTTEYIFIGKVVGYTESLKLPKTQSQTYGLIVEMTEKVYLPKIPKKHFEILPFGLGADCSTLGTNKSELQKDFPMNSEIRVIAKKAEIFSSELPDGSIRLEIRPREISSLALNTDGKGNRMSSANSFFDYKSFTYDMNEDSESKFYQPSFEVRKDLLRLHNSKNELEKNIILEKLLNIPVCCNDLKLYTVFKTYASSPAEAERLNRANLKATMSEEQYAQYLAYSDALSELVRLGHQSDTAEKALGKALEEGTPISKKALLERSLQILRKKKLN